MCSGLTYEAAGCESKLSTEAERQTTLRVSRIGMDVIPPHPQAPPPHSCTEAKMQATRNTNRTNPRKKSADLQSDKLRITGNTHTSPNCHMRKLEFCHISALKSGMFLSGEHWKTDTQCKTHVLSKLPFVKTQVLSHDIAALKSLHTS